MWQMGKDAWLIAAYIRGGGGINTADGLTKSLSSVNLGNFLDGDMFRIVTEAWKKEI